MTTRLPLRAFDSGLADSQPAQRDRQILGGADQLGGKIPSLPAPQELCDTARIASILFPTVTRPRQAVYHWRVTQQIPTYRVGGRIRVLGQSILDALQDAERQAQRARRRRQITAVSA